eukprot:7214352-Pyramimonas_sp.AAC.2
MKQRSVYVMYREAVEVGASVDEHGGGLLLAANLRPSQGGVVPLLDVPIAVHRGIHGGPGGDQRGHHARVPAHRRAVHGRQPVLPRASSLRMLSAITVRVPLIAA